GWSVLPLWWPTATRDCACGLPDCESTGKHPIRRLVPHGLHDATGQLDTIDEWWRLHAHANVGIRTGAKSGLVVLDVDGEAGRPLPPAPGWLLDLAVHADGEPQPVQLLSGDVRAYASAALESELRDVTQAPPGQRNHQLNRAAFTLGQLVGARLLDEAAVTTA